MHTLSVNTASQVNHFIIHLYQQYKMLLICVATTWLSIILCVIMHTYVIKIDTIAIIINKIYATCVDVRIKLLCMNVF